MRTPSIVLAALVVLLLAVGGVTAHEDHGDTTTHDDAPVNESAGDWATWMEQHMTEYMGAEAAEWMGMSYEEMGAHMGSRQGRSMMGGMGCH